MEHVPAIRAGDADRARGIGCPVAGRGIAGVLAVEATQAHGGSPATRLI
jgi:hypothetical protein